MVHVDNKTEKCTECSIKEEKINSLNERVADLNEKLDSFLEEKESLTDSLLKKDIELKEIEYRCEKLKSESSINKDLVQTYRDKMSSMKEREKSLHSDKESLNKAIEDLRLEHDQVLKSVTVLEKEKTSLLHFNQMQLSEKDSFILQLQDEIRNWDAKFTDMIEEKENLIKQDYSKSIGEFIENLEEKEKRIKLFERKVLDLTKCLNKEMKEKLIIQKNLDEIKKSEKDSNSMGKDYESDVDRNDCDRIDSNALKMVNIMYLRSIILKLLLGKPEESIHLIKAVAVILEFSHQEESSIKQSIEQKMTWPTIF